MTGRVSRSRAASVAAGALALAVVLAAPAQAATGTFSNPTPITIPAGAPGTTFGPADPYPSNINVAGLAGTVFDVNASISDFSHTFPDDVSLLLVGPSGHSVVLMAEAGGNADVSNLNLTFDDQAAGQLPNGPTLTSGTFMPSDFGGGQFPPPAPSNPGGGLSNLDGRSPNGEYSLFVFDQFSGDVGSIAGGWSLEITTLDTIITSGPNDTTKKKQATIAFNAEGFPGATFECSLDGRAAFRPCTSPTTVRVKKGTHIFAVQSTVGGITDQTPATDEWKVKKKKR
jgi:subtilisin-like proprotein convertase family protein